MRRIFSRAFVALPLVVLAGCGGDGAPDADVAALPPTERVDGDSAALADGFVKIEPRSSAPRSVRDAHLARARRRWDALPKDSLLERVPASLRAALDSAVAAELQAHAVELRARVGRTASGPSPSSRSRRAVAPPADGSLALLARAFSIFVPTTAWAAGPSRPAAQAEGEPVVRERTSVTLEGATIRTRRSLREFKANGRMGFELELRTSAEGTAGGISSTLSQTVRELVDVAYCPDRNGVAAGRREYSDVHRTESRGASPATSHLRASAQMIDEETADFSGHVGDDAALATLDARVEVSNRYQGRAREGAPVEGMHGHARGRIVGIGVTTEGRAYADVRNARTYVDVPRDIDPRMRDGMRDAVESAMQESALEKVFHFYSDAQMAWQGGECLEIRLVEDPDPSRLRLGERTSFVPEVRHRFDASSGLPLDRRASVGSIEGADSTAARATYRAPKAGAPDASRFRGEGADVTLRSVSRRGIADTTLRIASAEPAPERYRVTLTLRSESPQRGVGSEFVYRATLAALDDPEAAAGDLAGSGTYEGFLLARPANCILAKTAAPERFDVSGKLEASGAVMDMSFDGPPKPAMIFSLGTLDWSLKPLYGAEGPLATTEEEREGIKGLGTVMSGPPIDLTGPVTTITRARTSESSCGIVTTSTTIIRIERVR